MASEQLDLIRGSDAWMIKAHREAAAFARVNPYETPEQAENRAQHHEAEAARLEGMGAKQ